MLTKLIVNSYALLIEISLWLVLLLSLVGGGIIGGQMNAGFFGAVIGLLIGFIVAVVFFGGFLILDDIRKTVRTIENLKKPSV